MKRIELLKAAFTRALDLSIKQIDRTVVNSSFADFDDIHENTIQNCVINSLGLLSKDIEAAFSETLKQDVVELLDNLDASLEQHLAELADRGSDDVPTGSHSHGAMAESLVPLAQQVSQLREKEVNRLRTAVVQLNAETEAARSRTQAALASIRDELEVAAQHSEQLERYVAAIGRTE